jgi:hypothetical protein
MNVEINRLGEIQAEDAHNRFRVNDISAGNEIKVIFELGDVIHERFNFIDRV